MFLPELAAMQAVAKMKTTAQYPKTDHHKKLGFNAYTGTRVIIPIRELTAESAGFVNLCSRIADPSTINSRLPWKISA